MKRPELMAPAGSMAALRAALAAGADAVYLGGKQFNARQSAANFSDEELSTAIALAHRAGAKVYVTVNTLLKQEELASAVRFLRTLHNLGADAAIVQDPGLIAAARETTPQLELHASTQLTIHGAAGVQAMQQLGIRRVVLARELSAEQIAAIRQQTRIGLETFVHGALCVAYSGQCLLSSLTGGRSGNRGQCAQPCRLPYRLGSEQAAGYRLSPKDLCLYPQLSQLLQLGLDAWKIEGRLKRPAYVATVVRLYRSAIDRLLAGLPPARWQEAENELLQAFNRGFSRGYFLGKPGQKLLSGDQPGHRGVAIGRALPDGLIEPWQELRVGDVLLGPAGAEIKVGSIRQGRVEVPAAGPGRPVRVPGWTAKAGQEVRRLHSARQAAAAEELVNVWQPEPMPVRLIARLRARAPLQLTAAAAGQQVTVQGGLLPETAVHRPLDEELLLRQLQKTGDSGFVLQGLQAEMDSGLSLPVSEINHCRRQALDRLSELLWGQPHPLPEHCDLPDPVHCPTRGETARLAVAVPDQAAVLAALQFPVQRLYFGTSFHGFPRPAEMLTAYRQARESCQAKGVACYLRLPRVLPPEAEAAWLSALNAHPPAGLHVSNWAGVWMARRLGLPYVLGTSMNVANPQFIASVPDAEGLYLSPELKREEIVSLLSRQGQRVWLEIHARHLLMVHEQCLLAANAVCRAAARGCDRTDVLVDRKGYRFPLRGDATCRSYLYNSQVFSLLDQVPELLSKRLTAELLIDLELEAAERVAPILGCYQAAWRPGRDETLRPRLRQLFPQGLTRGHWRRGVE